MLNPYPLSMQEILTLSHMGYVRRTMRKDIRFEYSRNAEFLEQQFSNPHDLSRLQEMVDHHCMQHPHSRNVWPKGLVWVSETPKSPDVEASFCHSDFGIKV